MSFPLDTLTGVYSRAALMPLLQAALAQAQSYEQPLTLFFLDLDDFKSINDAFGHARGDVILAELGSYLRAFVGDRGQVVRYGGDEFLIILPAVDSDAAVALGKALVTAIQEQDFDGDPPLRLRLSLGVALFPQDGMDVEALLGVADRRHYQAKRSGKGLLVGPNNPPTEWHRQPLVPPRLIEREAALEALRSWFNDLEVHHHGVLRIEAPPRGGETRFLEEVQRLARLRGLAVLALSGNPARSRRYLGVLSEAARAWPLEVLPTQGLAPFFAALFREVARQNARGLLVTLDNPAWMDAASLQAVRTLLSEATPWPLGIAYTTSGMAGDFRAPLFRVIQLQPLSEYGTRLWVRQALQMEPPAAILAWLHTASGGLPGALEDLIEGLMAHQVLLPTAEGWRFQTSSAWSAFDPAQLRPARSSHNLPEPLLWPPLVGREEEIWALERQLFQRRLVVVVGPGGVGKSRLAMQVAWEHLEDFPDGVFRYSVAGDRSLDEVAIGLGEVLGLTFQASSISPWEQLLEHLRTRHALLLLEDVEQHPELRTFLWQCLDRAPRVYLLVTSRDALYLPAEWLFPLRGLACPPSSDIEGLEAYPAVQLFLQRAQQLQPAFGVAVDDHQHVVDLCQMSGGLPLAIQIVASWAASLGLAEAAHLIRQRPPWMEQAGTDRAGEQRLQNVLDAFWNLFSAEEQRVLLRLSVFRGGFTAEAARAIADASIFFLDGLVSKAYLNLETEGWYRTHPLLHQYAEERLHAFPTLAEDARRRHAEWMLSRVAQIGYALYGADQARALRMLEQDYPNLRHAWEWALGHQRFDLLLPALDTLSSMLGTRGRFMEAAHWLNETLQALTKADTANESEARRFLGRVLVRRGEFAYHLGDYPESLKMLESALELLQMDAETQAYATALDSLASTLRAVGRLDEAQERLQQALHFFRRIGDLRAVCEVINHLGVVAYQRGDNSLAAHYFRQALDVGRTLRYEGQVARALNNLANVALENGDYEQARVLLNESLEIAQRVGAAALHAAVLDSLGKVALGLGELKAASDAFGRGLVVALESQAWPLLLEILTNLARVWERQGEVALALVLLERVQSHPQAVYEIRRRAEVLRQHLDLSVLSADDLAAVRADWEGLSVEGMARRALYLIGGART
ncbi:diguanylate cyclase [Thermanaerothrix sp. 4228-RoL]|uniref:Diguanylate cyclase n=1 Tax=Thermanaerothrix solaris TaxID=3058434 RepID=A0ABU3NMN6_9CHLR|nr:diguanylate cyclase [Thermanaerothrix sp. 4228-RoL]MDT8898109.1 diguanylate cyclase [Thermanaerothrix sp. 4228-RoL]